jgi:hypothetical protein
MKETHANGPYDESAGGGNVSVWVAFAWGLASAASLPVGAIIAIHRSPREKLSGNMMAFGGGALLFALSIELFGSTIAQKEHFSTIDYNRIVLVMAASALGGGIIFIALDHLLNNAGAFLRKFSTLHSAQTRGYMGKLLGSRTISALQATHIFRNVPQAGLEQLLPHMEKVICLSPSALDLLQIYVDTSLRLVFGAGDISQKRLGDFV